SARCRGGTSCHERVSSSLTASAPTPPATTSECSAARAMLVTHPGEATSTASQKARKSPRAAAAPALPAGLGPPAAVARTRWPEVLEEIGLDFGWFQRSADERPADLEIEVQQRPPEFDGFGELAATYVTPRNVVYQQGERRVVDYFGRALSVLDETGTRLVIQ